MAQGDSVEDPIFCEGLFAAYAIAKHRLGLSSVDAARRKRLGIAGADRDGLYVDVYEHAGKRVFISSYGAYESETRKEALAVDAERKKLIEEMQAQGMSREEILAAFNPHGFKLQKAAPGELPPGVVVRTTDEKS